MSQCVPSWDLDNSTTRLNVPSMDYEVAELTWENGQLALHGLAPPRLSTKPPPNAVPRPAGAGTLESLVNQATTTYHVPHLKPPPGVNDLAPWFDHRHAAAAMDALVPCNNHHHHHQEDTSNHATRTCGGCKTNASVTESNPAAGMGGAGLTSTSLWSPENTSSGKEYAKTTSGDSVSHSRSQRKGGEEEEVGKKKMKSGSGKSSSSTKRIRAAAIHNQSERKRRDKINQRMKTLQKLVPNSSKTDKASILDEVIEYVKQLQAQVHTMHRMNIPQMMMPLQALHHQHLHMSMMAAAAAAAAAAQQPHHVPMDFNSLNRAAAAMSPSMMLPPPPPFMPVTGPWDMQGLDIMSAFLASQSAQPQQPMTMDAYNRLAMLYQQFQQGSGSGSRN